MKRRSVFSWFLAFAAVAVTTIAVAAGYTPQYPVSVSDTAYLRSPIVYHQRYQLVVDGADLDVAPGAAGWLAPIVTGTATGQPSVGTLLLGTNILLNDVAVAGQTCSTMIANAAANVDAIKGQRGDAGDALTTEMVVFPAGCENDAVAGASAATIEGYASTYGTARKSAGWPHVGCRGPLRTSAYPSAVYAAVETYYAGLTFPTSWCDKYYDPGADPTLGADAGYLDPAFRNSDQTLNNGGAVRIVVGMTAIVRSGLGLP